MLAGAASDARNCAAGEHRAVLDRLLQEIMVTHEGHLTTGYAGTRALLEGLTAEGRADIAYSVATQTSYPGWGYMVICGATTMWEQWFLALGNGMNSRRPRQLQPDQRLALLRARRDRSRRGASGLRALHSPPNVVGDLTSARATVDTVRGKISAHWDRAADGVRLQVEVPANSQATVSIPTIGLHEVSVSETGTPLWRAGALAATIEGISSGRDDGAWISFDLGSGTYDLRLTGTRWKFFKSTKDTKGHKCRRCSSSCPFVSFANSKPFISSTSKPETWTAFPVSEDWRQASQTAMMATASSAGRSYGLAALERLEESAEGVEDDVVLVAVEGRDVEARRSSQAQPS